MGKECTEVREGGSGWVSDLYQVSMDWDWTGLDWLS